MLTDITLEPFTSETHFANERHGHGPAKIDLTQGQLRVLALLAEGESNKTIARRLGIAESTVKTHLTAIFKALKVHNRSQAIIAALRLTAAFRQEAAGDELPMTSLLPYMVRRRFDRNEVLFRKGDASNALYYVCHGTIALEEIEVSLAPGSLFGEVGLFAPGRKRTWTATCRTSGEMLAMTAQDAMQAYYQNPRFALFLTRLIVERLSADALRWSPWK